MDKMPLKLKIYTGFIISLSLICLLIGFKQYGTETTVSSLVFFLILAIISDFFYINLKTDTTVSVMFAVGLASVLVLNPFATSAIALLTFVISIEHVKGEGFRFFKRNFYKELFNGSAYSLCALASGFMYNLSIEFFPFTYGKINIVGTVFAVITYTVVNILIYMILMSILEERSVKELLMSNSWLIRNFLAISPLGIILALAYLNFGKFVVILFFVPLLLARYSFKLYMDMRHVYFETIKALSSAMEAKDQYTNGHSYRVADYAVGIAKQMGFDHERIDRIKTAAILHDIGKIGVTDTILNKPGDLAEAEYMVIQRHPEIGAKILSEVDFLGEVANIIKYHHERYDGKGYPEGLAGPAIPIEACILSVADAYDAMTSDRPYRKAMTSQMAQNILTKESGTQFHPIVAKAFQDHISTWEGEISNVG